MRVAIDPGLDTGWSIWLERPARPSFELLACGLGDPRSSRAHIASAISSVLIESPVIYPHSKANPNDIIRLAVNAGTWAGRYEMLGACVEFVEPSRWKGQVPKDIHHGRVWSALTPEEQKIVDSAVKSRPASKRHNILDAVGLGLWAAKRLGR